MDKDMVTAVVRQLPAEGHKATVRRVHEMLGAGSFRDIAKFLREAREFLDDEEVLELETDLPAPAPPAPGEIRQAFRSAEEVGREMGRVSAMLDDARERLRDLVDHRPLQAMEPEDVEDWVIAKRGYIEDVTTLHEIITRLSHLYLERQSEQIAFRAQGNQLQRRADEIRMALPQCTRNIVEAEQELVVLLRDQEHARQLAERRVATAHATKRRYEAELRDLVGDR